MRRETPENQPNCSSCYGAGTRVEVHRSRYELERVLNKYGAAEVLFVEADANASIQFELHGRYVQLALPLPDPQDPRFTHTPSGKPRTPTAQERAYDQALREHWRSLIVAVRGKLQSVESGISTFEHEFDRFLLPHFAKKEKKRNRKAPKSVSWLLGGSHSLAIALVAAFLVPASAVGAFALPTNVVGHLAAPFRSSVVDDSAAAGRDGSGLVLAKGGWSASSGNAGAPSAHAGRLLSLRSELLGSTDGQLRQEASLSSPPVEPPDVPGPVGAPAGANTTPLSNDGPPSPPSPPAGGGGQQQPASDSGPSAPPPPDDTPVTPPVDSGDSQPSDSGEDQQSTPATDPAPAEPPTDAPAPDDASSTPATDGAADPTAPPSSGDDTSPGNGNGNGNGQGQGNGNGNGNGNGQGNGQGQGNGKGKGGK
jgi:hypothetical protein